MKRSHAGIATAIGIVGLCAWSVVRTTRPPAVVPASAPAIEFSAERALTHVRSIAERPHPIGSVDHDRVRDYVASQLHGLGLPPSIQQTTAVGTRYRNAGRVQNVVARLPGGTPGHAVLLVAHYDGVEAGPGAADDGAGSAVLLETARALRAGGRLTHDVILLFTDGEEAGLIGAAAFAREHPWARNVDVVINFEARGTTGRSYMFETGPGNFDVARVLRTVPDVTAGSVFTAIYRVLPNDTDLSELAVLGRPALNFAFADGIERYHTSHDDLAHLDPRSVQHHGTQALALARAFGNGPLPRPFTGDAVFFDLPVVGLVVYPQTLSLPLALIVLALVGAVGHRVHQHDPHWIGGAASAATAVVVSVVVACCLAYYGASALTTLHEGMTRGGVPSWSGVYAAALTMLALVPVALGYWLTRRFAGGQSAHLGALAVWSLISLVVSVVAPGASYLFSWPVAIACLAALIPRRRGVAVEVATWVAAGVSLLLLAGLAYVTGSVMLGLHGPGSIVLAMFAALIAWLNAPLLERLTVGRRWGAAGWAFGAALLLFVIGVVTVRRSESHPAPSVLVYAMDADSSDAWLATLAVADANPWTSAVIPLSSANGDPPTWLARMFGSRRQPLARRAPRVSEPAPAAAVVSDSTIGGQRRVLLRVTAPEGTTSLTMRVIGAKVLASAIDGRGADTTRYRGRSAQWSMQYWAVPKAGATVALILDAGAKFELELEARRSGIPALPGIAIPTRPSDVVPTQYGDVTIIRRRFAL